MDVEVTRGVIDSLHSEAAKAMPEECCGLLLGTQAGRIEQLKPARNVDPDPHHRFAVDPATLFAAHKAARSGGLQVLGYYHSHPTGKPIPSATDTEHSTGDWRIWAIIGEGTVAFWRDRGNGFDEVTYHMV